MRRILPALVLLVVGCAAEPPPRAPARRAATATPKTTTAAAEMPAGAPREELPWADFTPETFARAKAEHRYIVLDGAAEWCHWCHVMEATTYHDPEVRKILAAHFIAVKVDVDARPDVEERYGDYGWPATVMFAPDATELGKYRGYIEPEKFRGILEEIVASGVAEGRPAAAEKVALKAPRTPLSEEHLAWIQTSVEVALDDLYDDEQGSWGFRQKAPLGYDNAWLLLKASRGDAEAKKKALFTLDKQAQLIDPVWGGIYQYSQAKDWDSPHFEKLMTFQAPALENYASAYRLTNDPQQLARARAMLGYIDRFLKGPDGGFYTTQDADLNAHDRKQAFMDGHQYYVLGEKERLAAGIPRIDDHEYGKENGLAIAAYATMFEITKDAAVLASAEKAATRMLASHGTKRGAITHDAVDPKQEQKTFFLSDNAAFGFGLIRLYEATTNATYLESARKIADFMITDLTDEDGGGFFSSTKDPDAVGVFAKRRVPFEDNVMALRFLAHLARVVPKADAKKYGVSIDRVLRAISTPEEIKARGRMTGDYLLALEETKGVR